MVASPFWWALTLPPLRIITSRRIVLVFGTIVLSWHSRPARISRTILWRSRTVRSICTVITGLEFGSPSFTAPPLPPRPVKANTASAAALANKHGKESEEGIRFTFTLFENQRRWLGLGWTSSMLAYERSAWTDEHLNPTGDTHTFVLPDVEGGMAGWRWVESSEWHVEQSSTRTGKSAEENEDDEDSWIYYDNKWHDGRRGRDGWGRYTRRRKWTRDAELVDIIPNDKPIEQTAAAAGNSPTPASEADTDATTVVADNDTRDSSTVAASPSRSTVNSEVGSPPANGKRKLWFPRSGRDSTRDRGGSSASATASISGSMESTQSWSAGHDHVVTPTVQLKQREADWGLGDDVSMGLG